METKVITERITLPIPTEPHHSQMGAFVARPAQPGTYPGILLFMEIFGINSHIQDVAQRLAKQGYLVVVPDYFHRTAPGIELNYNAEGVAKGMPLRRQLKRSEVLRDIEAALHYIKARPDTLPRMGAIGFCIGGHIAYLAATQFDIAATASFYGGGIASDEIQLSQPEPTVNLTPGIARHNGKILCFFGGHDESIPLGEREKIRHTLEEAEVRHEVIVYPQANHGFFCDQRASFHQPSRDDAWQRVLKLFNQELKGK